MKFKTLFKRITWTVNIILIALILILVDMAYGYHLINKHFAIGYITSSLAIGFIYCFVYTYGLIRLRSLHKRNWAGLKKATFSKFCYAAFELRIKPFIAITTKPIGEVMKSMDGEIGEMLSSDNEEDAKKCFEYVDLFMRPHLIRLIRTLKTELAVETEDARALIVAHALNYTYLGEKFDKLTPRQKEAIGMLYSDIAKEIGTNVGGDKKRLTFEEFDSAFEKMYSGKIVFTDKCVESMRAVENLAFDGCMRMNTLRYYPLVLTISFTRTDMWNYLAKDL